MQLKAKSLINVVSAMHRTLFANLFGAPEKASQRRCCRRNGTHYATRENVPRPRNYVNIARAQVFGSGRKQSSVDRLNKPSNDV